MGNPKHLLAEWPRLRRRLARARRRALFSDFDGTLIWIRPRLRPARLAPPLQRLLTAAVARGDVVGIVSGRRLKSLREAVGLEGIWYAAVHGCYLRSPHGRQFVLLDRKALRRVAAATKHLLRRLQGLPGISIEVKRAVVTVHYRRAAPRVREQARTEVQECLRPGLSLMRSKKAWELVPEMSGKVVDKWAAIQFILKRERVARADYAAVVHLGDDTTDEHVFRALDGITVAIGKRRRTAARYYLNHAGEVRKFLDLWSRLPNDGEP
ncbi:MAG: trehalose-phosphatase [Candidatus Acidiferrales bacterium]